MSSDGNHSDSNGHRRGRDTDSELVSRAISNWRNGLSPDALALLAAHPQLANQKSLVLDLAYEEYCLRKEKGESVTPNQFCDKFPDWHRSLARLLDVHEFLDHHPEFAPAQEQTQWPRPGDVVCGFEIERKIGSGAFARVYAARDPTLGYRQVVVKVSRAGSTEAMTLGRLTHENIVPVNSVKVDAQTGLTAICMPYQGEATLVDLLEASFKAGQPPQSADVILAVARRNAAFTGDVKASRPKIAEWKRKSYVDGVVGLGIRLAGALAYAHSHGVLHRDLKPSNVLLAPDGEPKLLDFNLSWDTRLAGARLGGTVPYMSPEQVESVLLGKATDKRGSVDGRSDLFSLGVLLYELLTGATPFGTTGSPGDELRDVEELLKRQRLGANPIEQLNPDVDPALSQIIAWCLQFDPAERPQNAGELEAALMQYLRPTSQMHRALRRRRKLLAGVLFAVVVAAAGTGIWLVGRPPYSARAFQTGLASYESGNWDEAINRWTAAIDADRPPADLLFARAMAKGQRGSYEEAVNDLKLARQLSNAGAIPATIAYCYALAGKHRDAVHWSGDSIEQGFINAALLNNLRYSGLQLPMSNTARIFLDRAVEAAPDLAAGYLNRALFELEMPRGDKPEVSAIVKDIETALRLAPDDWTVQRDAARMFAEFSIEQPAYRRQAFNCLQRVLELGGSLSNLDEQKWFGRLRDDREFVQILSSLPTTSVPEPPSFAPPYPNPVLR